MVDYFALIAPTIESLSKSTVEERRQVYDRLIKMLEAQLRSADPPRSEIDILRERIDLEAAIRRVERRIQAGQISGVISASPDNLRPSDEQIAVSSIAPMPEPPKIKIPGPNTDSVTDPGEEKNATDSSSNPPSVSQPPQLPQPDPSQTSATTPVTAPASTQPTTPSPAAPTVPTQPADWASLVPQPRATRAPFSPMVQAPPPQASLTPQPGPPRRAGPPPSELPIGPPRRLPPEQTTPSGLPIRTPQQRGLPPLAGEPDAGRAIYGQRDADPRLPASRLRDLPDAFRSMPGALTSQRAPTRSLESQRDYGILPQGMTGDAGRPIAPSPTSFRRPDASPQPSPPQPAVEPYRDAERVLREEDYAKTQTATREQVSDSQSSDTSRPTVSIGFRPRASMLPTRGSGGWQRLAIISACVVAILGGIAMTAYLLRDDPNEFKNATGKYAATEKPQADEKISDRLPTQAPAKNVTPTNPTSPQSNTPQQQGTNSQASPSAPTPDANGVLTQKAMLVMEATDQSAPAPSLNGRVTWKLETLRSVVNNASEIGSRATIDIPEAGLSATFVFRRNRDPQSANSHMIEVGFTLSDNNATGKIRDIRVPELRSDETARGTPLSGIPVPVTENVFLVGLNALPSEMQKNLELLRSQNWFAILLRFANGKRGILMFEKGKTGERVMEDAMQAWKAN